MMRTKDFQHNFRNCLKRYTFIPLPRSRSAGAGKQNECLGVWAALCAAQTPTGALRLPNWGTSEVFQQFLSKPGTVVKVPRLQSNREIPPLRTPGAPRLTFTAGPAGLLEVRQL